MAQQALNRLHISALVDEKGREAVTEVVESKSLPRLKPDADFERGGTNLVLRHYAGIQRSLPVRLSIEPIPAPAFCFRTGWNYMTTHH